MPGKAGARPLPLDYRSCTPKPGSRNGMMPRPEKSASGCSAGLIGTKVLLIDDGQESLHMLSTALTGSGATVVTALSLSAVGRSRVRPQGSPCTWQNRWIPSHSSACWNAAELGRREYYGTEESITRAARNQVTDLRGASRMLVDAITGITHVVEAMHTDIAECAEREVSFAKRIHIQPGRGSPRVGTLSKNQHR